MSRMFVLFVLGNLIAHCVGGVNEDVHDRFVWAVEGGRPGWVIYAAVGEELMLPCRIGTQGSDAPWINVAWQKDNQTLEMDERLSITSEGHLNISTVVHQNVDNSDEGYYHCLVRLPDGVVVSPTIHLLMPRMNKNISIISSHGSVVEGRLVRLSCNVISSPATNITWLHNNSVINITDRFSTPQAGILHIRPVQLTDGGFYRCLASNSLLREQSQRSEIINLVVVPQCTNEAHVPPHFLQDSLLPDEKIIQVIEGQRVVVECLASGWPLPHVLWFNGSSNWQEWEEYEPSDRIKITDGTLIIEDIHKSDSRTYRCIATHTNPYTQRDHSIIQDTVLDVLIPPTIIVPPQKVSKLLAKTARLNCAARGHPQPQITWFRKGRPVNLTGDFHQRHDGQLINTFPMPSDSGLYQCIAYNQAGYDSQWAYLSVNSPGDLPDPPTQLSISNLTPYSAVVNWSPVPPKPGQPPVRGYSLKYNTLGNLGMARYALSTSTSITLENLHPNTDYVVGIHSFSTYPSEQSQPLMFRTPDAVPSSASSIAMKASSNNSIMVHWKELTKNKANGEIVGHRIYWRKRRQFQTHNVSDSQYSFEITGLKPGKKYYVLVLAGTSAGFPDPRDFDDSWVSLQLPKHIDEPDNTTALSISSNTAMIEEETNNIMRYEISMCHDDSISEAIFNVTGDLDIIIPSVISIKLLNGTEGNINNEIIAKFYNAKQELKAVQTKVTIIQAQLDNLKAENVDAEVEHRRAQDKLNDAKAALRSASRRLSQTLTKVSNAENLLHIAKTELNTAEMKLNMAEAEFTDYKYGE